jgi:thymidine kinase
MAKLYFYYAAMNAGKTTSLLQAAFNYNEKKMTPLLLTSAQDDRSPRGIISSRIGFSAPAKTFTPEVDMWKWFTEELCHLSPHIILIDESQFLMPSQVWDLARIVDAYNIPVLCYGLRTDYSGTPFPGSLTLLGIADVLTEIKNICGCGRKAIMNLRLDKDRAPVLSGEVIMIGDNKDYEACCRRCFSHRRHHKAQQTNVVLSKLGTVV